MVWQLESEVVSSSGHPKQDHHFMSKRRARRDWFTCSPHLGVSPFHPRHLSSSFETIKGREASCEVCEALQL